MIIYKLVVSCIVKPNLVLWDWSGTIEKNDNATFFLRNKSLNKYLDLHFEANQYDEFYDYWQNISTSLQNKIQVRFKLESENYLCLATYALSLIKYFSDNKIIQCIITNGPSRDVKNKLARLKLDHHFAEIIGSEDQFALKPNPSSALYLCKQYTVKNDDNVWFIGDSDQDMEFAMHARIRGIKVNKGLDAVWKLIDQPNENTSASNATTTQNVNMNASETGLNVNHDKTTNDDQIKS